MLKRKQRTKEETESPNQTQEASTDVDMAAVDAMVDEIDTAIKEHEDERHVQAARVFQDEMRKYHGCSQWYEDLEAVLKFLDNERLARGIRGRGCL